MRFIGCFFLTVTVLTLAELYLLIEVAQRYSFWTTLGLCVLTGVVGGAMVRAQGLRTLIDIRTQLGQGKMPAESIGSGMVLLIIGALFMTPGFITDTLAFLMLIPPLRVLTVKGLYGWFHQRITVVNVGGGPGGPQGRRRPEDVIIEVDPDDIHDDTRDQPDRDHPGIDPRSPKR